MAVRRPLIDVIDAGLNPRVAHTQLNKQGHLIKAHPTLTAPILSVADMKEHLLVNDKKDVLTEGDDSQVEEIDKVVAREVPKPATRPVQVKPVEAKKIDKTPKPV